MSNHTEHPTLTQIRQAIESNDGTYMRLRAYLGSTAYRVNGVTMNKSEMVERFKRGELWKKRLQSGYT